MNLIIEFLIIAGVVGAVTFGVHRLWEDNVADPYRLEGKQAQRAEDAPILKRAEDDKAAAEAARGRAEAETAGYKESVGRQNDAVKKAEAQAKANAEAARLAQIESAKRANEILPVIAEYQRRARDSSTKELSCKEELTMTAEELRNVLKDRLKGKTK